MDRERPTPDIAPRPIYKHRRKCPDKKCAECAVTLMQKNQAEIEFN